MNRDIKIASFLSFVFSGIIIGVALWMAKI